MSDSYRIEIELATKGDLDAKLGGIGRGAAHAEGKVGNLNQAFQQFSSMVQGLGSKVMAPMDMVASKVAGLTVGFAKLAGAAGIGLATYGVVQLQNELEKTTISIASMMNANGMSSGIEDGMRKSAAVMKDMRKDAASLPGEFADLSGIMRTVMIPSAHNGMGIDDVRKMSAKIMAAGAVTGLPMDMVARESAQLMEGRAGAHNVFGQRLMGLSGDAAEKFNKSSGADRVKQINEALDKFAPAIEVFKDSFDGLSSTLLDNAKQFLGAATMPLFGRVKDSMKELNGWFDKNTTKWESYAEVIGADLAKAFDLAKEKILEWGPVVFDFANNAYSKIVEVWYRVEPVVARIAGMVKGFMADPAAFDKIEHLIKVYAGLKVGQTVGGGILNATSGVLSAASGAKALGLFGGGEAAAAGAGAAGGAEAAGVGLGAVAAPVAVLTAALYGAVAAESDYQEKKQDSWFFAKVFHATWETLKWQWQTIMDNMASAANGLLELLTPLAEVLGTALVGAANAALVALTLVSEVLATVFGSFASVPGLGGGGVAGPSHDTRTVSEKAYATEQAKIIGMGLEGKGKSVQEQISAAASEAKKAAGPKHGGGGGTNVQKVEIVVTSSSDPSRIARMVMSEIENIKRHPKVSRDVPNWSAS